MMLKEKCLHATPPCSLTTLWIPIMVVKLHKTCYLVQIDTIFFLQIQMVYFIGINIVFVK